MKITLDTKNNTLKVGKKTFGYDMPTATQDDVICYLRNFILKNTKLSDYEEDSMWMSYRYCIGRHTIAAHMRAGDIAEQCYGRIKTERSVFTAYDINREIEQRMMYGCGPEWYFPITSLNRIYTSAIDIFCQFVEDYGIKSKEDLLKYKDVHVILCDMDERGYKLETITWEEWLRPQVYKICREFYESDSMTEDRAWEIYESVMSQKTGCNFDNTLREEFNKISKGKTDKNYFSLMDVEDLFVWNHLVHLFDLDHHHKSVLVDGTECEWYWTYVNDTEKREDGYYYRKEIGYKKIRVPVDSRIGSVTTWIPDEAIAGEIY